MKKVLLGASGLLLLAVIVWAAWPADTDVPPPEHGNETPTVGLEEQLKALEEAPRGDGGRATVHGTVVDADGNPVPGAKVAVSRSPAVLTATCTVCGSALFDDADPSVGRQLVEMARAGKLAGKPVGETVAGPDGAFELEVPQEQLTFDATAADGRVGNVERDPEETDLEITVAPRQPSRLRVVTGEEEQKPVPNAKLFVVSRNTFQFVEVFSDAQGIATVANLEGDAGLWIFAEARGYGAQVVPVVVRGEPGIEGETADDAEEVHLAPARSLLVHTTAGGKPVDATVSLGGGGAHPRQAKAHDGQARFDELTQWDLEVTATLGALTAPKRTVTLDRELTEVEVELRQGARALVTVVDEGGQPAAASLNLTNDEDQQEGQSTEKGEIVTLGPLAEGSYLLTVEQPGFRTVERPVDLKPGDNPIEVVLKKSSGLKGRVVDEQGQPVPGVAVEARVPPNPLVVGTSDDEGNFELEIDEPGPVDLSASSSEHGKGEAHVTAPAEKVVLKLLPRARLKVHVVSPEGKPERGMVMVNGRLGQEGAVQAGADGEALFAGLEPGEVEVVVVTRRLSPPAGKKVTLDEGRLTEVTVTLDPGESASGTVVDDKGKPMPSIQVITAPMAAASVSDAEGHFELEGLEPGTTYQVEVEDDAWQAQPMSFKAGQQLRVVLVPRPTVHGRVVGANGAPLAHFEVEGNPIDAPDGRFEVPAHPTEGQLFIVISAKDYKTYSYEGPFKADLGDLVLQSAGEVYGLVVDETGKPVSGAVVSPSSGEVSITTGSTGEFRMKLVEESDSISARRGQAKGTTPLELGRPLRITLSGPTQVTGRVLDEKGRPVAAVVTARDADSNTVKADASNDGRFRLELAQGPWVFSTRLSMAGQLVQVAGAQMEITLGAPPGTCGLLVKANAPVSSVVLLPGEVADEGELLSDDQRPGAVVLETYGERVARAAGVSCGTYTLFATFGEQVARQVVQVRSQDLVVEVAEPAEHPGEPLPPSDVAPVPDPVVVRHRVIVY